MLKHGEVVEEGSHAQLLQEHPDGTYSDLVKRQQIADEIPTEETTKVEKNDEEKEDGNKSPEKLDFIERALTKQTEADDIDQTELE